MLLSTKKRRKWRIFANVRDLHLMRVGEKIALESQPKHCTEEGLLFQDQPTWGMESDNGIQ